MLCPTFLHSVVLQVMKNATRGMEISITCVTSNRIIMAVASDVLTTQFSDCPVLSHRMYSDTCCTIASESIDAIAKIAVSRAMM